MFFDFILETPGIVFPLFLDIVNHTNMNDGIGRENSFQDWSRSSITSCSIGAISSSTSSTVPRASWTRSFPRCSSVWALARRQPDHGDGEWYWEGGEGGGTIVSRYFNVEVT